MTNNNKTSGQSNLTQGCIAAEHGRFSRIRQMAPMCTPYIERQKMIAMATSLKTSKSATTSSDSLTPKTHR